MNQPSVCVHGVEELVVVQVLAGNRAEGLGFREVQGKPISALYQTFSPWGIPREMPFKRGHVASSSSQFKKV